MQRGLWDRRNSIFRGRVLQTQSADSADDSADDSAEVSDASDTDAVQLLPTDIAGHALGFDVDANGRLALRCVDLLGDVDESCRVSNQHWMHNLEDNWKWQHARQEQLWPPEAGGGAVSWTCPLRVLRAHAGTQDRQTMRSPSRTRNAFRFAHLTSPHTYAHPIVAGARDLLLMPARFISDTQACTADKHASASVCHSPALLARSIAHTREMLWQTVSYPKEHSAPGVSCAQILDWPHQPFLTWDELASPGTEYARLHCNVFDRLPQFQLQLQARAAPQMHSGRSSVDAGGVCHMGPLRRMAVRAPNLQAVLQHCGAGADGGLRCRYYNPSTQRSAVRAEPSIARSAPAVSRPLRKNTPCARCEQHSAAAFVAPDGALLDTPGERRMLSTGEHVHVATARLVAAFLRRLVCPVAVDAPCAELLRIFNTAHWTSGAFLQGLLAASSAADFAADFYRAPLPAESAAPAHAYASDAQLWERNWAWCDPRTGVCAGNVSKQDWINPRTRGPARAKIHEAVSVAPVGAGYSHTMKAAG